MDVKFFDSEVSQPENYFRKCLELYFIKDLSQHHQESKTTGGDLAVVELFISFENLIYNFKSAACLWIMQHENGKHSKECSHECLL